MKYNEHILNCKHCGKAFQGVKTAKFCCKKCSSENKKQRIIKICECCNSPFEVTSDWGKDRKYCSFECKSKDRKSKLVELKCDNCSKVFNRKESKIKRATKIGSNHNFCCHKCHNQYLNKNKIRPINKNKNAGLKRLLLQWSKKIKERDEYTCQLCGLFDKIWLQAHHIKSKSKFPELMFNLNNGITLCLECHLLQHTDDKRAFGLINAKIRERDAKKNKK